ncbi:DUF3800 domain-containing protein [Chromatiaceae bacterium AAb-1]|nr:DUF3800 domain-containing protein [Chromatiaceae bacterium AAb-1]
MHLLYIDESSSVADPNQEYFVLAGVSVFEAKTHWVEQTLNTVAESFNTQDPWSIELHGSPMRSGREGWKAYPLQDRLNGIDKVLQEAVVGQHGRALRLFGAVVKKSSLVGGALLSTLLSNWSVDLTCF